MKKHKNKELDEFLRKTFQQEELEHTPIDLVSSVMDSIAEINKKNTVTKFKPLISMQTWILIGVVVIMLFGYLILRLNIDNSWFISTTKLNTVVGLDVFISNFKNYTVSSGTMYGAIGLLVFVCIQLFYLKKFFDKRQVII